MTSGLIIRLLPLAASQFAVVAGYDGINASFPVGNLADPQPKTVCQGNTGSNPLGIKFDIDLGADTSFDTVAAIGSNMSFASGRWAVWGYTSAAGLPAAGAETAGAALFGTAGLGNLGVAPTTLVTRRSGFLTGATVSRRYLRIAMQETPAANPDGFVNLGVLCIGQSIPLGYNYELGSGRKIEDQSIVRQLPGGETFSERGGRVPVWRATWSNLTEAEMRNIWSLLQEVGTGGQVLAIEDPDATTGQAERIHYAQIDSLDFIERVQIDKQRIDLRFRDLI